MLAEEIQILERQTKLLNRQKEINRQYFYRKRGIDTSSKDEQSKSSTSKSRKARGQIQQDQLPDKRSIVKFESEKMRKEVEDFINKESEKCQKRVKEIVDVVKSEEIDLLRIDGVERRFDKEYLKAVVIEPIQAQIGSTMKRHDECINLLQTFLNIRQQSESGQHEFESLLQSMFEEFKQ